MYQCVWVSVLPLTTILVLDFGTVRRGGGGGGYFVYRTNGLYIQIKETLKR